jgi:hypothetical protein
MDVIDKGNYQIEVGLSEVDVKKLWFGGQIEDRGILTGSEKLILIVSKEKRDRMIPEIERKPAEVKYNPKHSPPYVSEEVVKERQERDKVYAKYIENGDVEVYMSEETLWRIHPDGIVEINAKMPQLLKYHPKNNVKIFVKIPF